MATIFTQELQVKMSTAIWSMSTIYGPDPRGPSAIEIHLRHPHASAVGELETDRHNIQM